MSMLPYFRLKLKIVSILALFCFVSFSQVNAISQQLPEPMPVPPAPIWGLVKLVDTNPAPDVVEVELKAQETTLDVSQKVTLPMYTFNGFFPGPLLEAKAGDRVVVHFTNLLKEPTTIHWHGLRISSEMDGNPRIQNPVPAGGTFTYDFVVPEAGTFWYHPHVRSNEQIEKGMYGGIVVRAKDEPLYENDRYLVLDDVLLDANGFVPFLTSPMEAMHGRFGNFLVINGHLIADGFLLPADAKKNAVERWRIVNTSNARTMVLEIPGATFKVIGTDGGLLQKPYTTTRLEVAVGQRFDLEVKFDQGTDATLVSQVLTSDGKGGAVEVPIPLMKVAVGADASTMAAPVLHPPVPQAAKMVSRVVTLDFDAINDPQMGIMWRINGKSHDHTPLFTAAKGETVLLRLTNKVGMEHPFHLHGQFFEVPGRPLEPGLKDVVLLPGFESVDLIATLDNPGEWMAHCHILEHSELGMMAEFVVTP